MLSILLNKKIEDVNKYIQKRWSDNSPYNTGLNISGDYIYSICPGTVIFIGIDEDNKQVVNVIVNDNQLIRYCNLKGIDVYLGQFVELNTPIGLADRFVRLEYCSSNDSDWPVRINDKTYYKHNPEGLLDGSLKLDVIAEQSYTVSACDIYIGDTQDVDELESYGPDLG